LDGLAKEADLIEDALLTIAWDVDDVLNDLMRLWLEHAWRPANPDCSVRYEDLNENPPNNIIGVKLEEYLTSLDSFRLSGIYDDMKPVEEIKDWFLVNGNKYRHIALTAVPIAAAPLSARWVFNNFGPWIRTFHFVPSSREQERIPEYDKDKGEYLKWLGKVDVLIDDNETNIRAARTAGVRGILVPRPWNGCNNTLSESLAILGKEL